MERTPRMVAFTYRRFLTDFLPGFLVVMAVVIAGVLRNPDSELAQEFRSLPDWVQASVVVLLSIPVGVVAGYLSNAIFDDFCFSTKSLQWGDFILSPYESSELVKEHISRLTKKLSDDGGEALPQNAMPSLVIAARNVIRLHASGYLVEHLERLDGVSILFRALALVSMLYAGVLLWTYSPYRSALISALILFFPVSARVAVEAGKRRPRWGQRVRGSLWIVVLCAWVGAFGYVALPIGIGGVLIGVLAITMLVLHKKTTERTDAEVLALMTHGQFYEELKSLVAVL